MGARSLSSLYQPRSAFIANPDLRHQHTFPAHLSCGHRLLVVIGHRLCERWGTFCVDNEITRIAPTSNVTPSTLCCIAAPDPSPIVATTLPPLSAYQIGVITGVSARIIRFRSCALVFCAPLKVTDVSDDSHDSRFGRDLGRGGTFTSIVSIPRRVRGSASSCIKNTLRGLVR